MITIKRFRSTDTVSFDQAREIRQSVFIEEQNVPEVLEYEYEEEAEHYLILDAGVPVGTARWRRTAKGIKLERFAVQHTQRGKGYGTLILERVLADVVPLNSEIYLHAQMAAVRYYQKAGFTTKGDPFMEAGIEHYFMVYQR